MATEFIIQNEDLSFSCTVCDIKFSGSKAGSKSHRKQHYETKTHKEKEAEYEKLKASSAFLTQFKTVSEQKELLERFAKLLCQAIIKENIENKKALERVIEKCRIMTLKTYFYLVEAAFNNRMKAILVLNSKDNAPSKEFDFEAFLLSNKLKFGSLNEKNMVKAFETFLVLPDKEKLQKFEATELDCFKIYPVYWDAIRREIARIENYSEVFDFIRVYFGLSELDRYSCSYELLFRINSLKSKYSNEESEKKTEAQKELDKVEEDLVSICKEFTEKKIERKSEAQLFYEDTKRNLHLYHRKSYLILDKVQYYYRYNHELSKRDVEFLEKTKALANELEREELRKCLEEQKEEVAKKKRDWEKQYKEQCAVEEAEERKRLEATQIKEADEKKKCEVAKEAEEKKKLEAEREKLKRMKKNYKLF